METMFQIFKDKMKKITDSQTFLIEQRSGLGRFILEIENKKKNDQKLIKELKSELSHYDISILEHIHMNESFMDYAYKLCLKLLFLLKKNKEESGKTDFLFK